MKTQTHFALVVASICLSAALPARPQNVRQSSSLTTKTVTLNLHKRPFTDFSRTLAAQLGRAILVDGEPFPKEGDVEFTGSGREALDKVAAAFDCDWAEGKHGVILMRKRFTDLADAPQFSQGEWQFTARSICNSLNMLSSDHIPHLQSDYAVQLFHLLTSEQVQELKDGKRLYTRNLPQEHKDVVHNWMFYSVFANLYNGWQSLLELTDAMPYSCLKRQDREIDMPEGNAYPDTIEAQGDDDSRTGKIKAGANQASALLYADHDRNGRRRERLLAFKYTPGAKKPEKKP